MHTCSDSYISSMYEFVKYYSGANLPVFKSLNFYLPKSIMCFFDPLKVPSPAPRMCLEKFRFNTNDVNISIPKILLYLLLVESPTWQYYIKINLALNSGHLKYILTFILGVRLPDWIFHCITAYIFVLNFVIILIIKIVGLHSLSINIIKFLKSTFPLRVFINPCRIG